MADYRTEPSDQSVTALVTGIVNDAQELIRQQFALLRAEVREDFRKTREAALVMAAGGAVALLGALLLVLALPLFLAWAVPAVPLWAWFAIVGAVLAAAGGGLVYGGVRKLESFNPLPDQTVQALRENVRWQTTTPK